MLPDLRIVIAAVVSTFVLSVGVGFFASSRLIHEQMIARVDTKGHDDTPINRIALNWPEPTKVERNLDLDFAISAKGSRNPVRDIAAAPAENIKPVPQATKTETPNTVSSSPAETPPSSPQTIAAAPASAPVEITAQESSAPELETATALQESAAVAPEPAVSAEKKEDANDQEPSVPEPSGQAASAEAPSAEAPGPETPSASVAKAPDPIEDPAPAPVEALQSTEAQQPKTDTQVLVHLNENETATIESTGSVATPAPEAPEIPLPAARPKLALQHEAGDAASTVNPAHIEPAKAPVSERKRRRRTVIRTRPAPRPQPAPAPAPQIQPFDFFGLFRTTPAPPRIPQVAKPTTPVG